MQPTALLPCWSIPGIPANVITRWVRSKTLGLLNNTWDRNTRHNGGLNSRTRGSALTRYPPSVRTDRHAIAQPSTPTPVRWKVFQRLFTGMSSSGPAAMLPDMGTSAPTLMCMSVLSTPRTSTNICMIICRSHGGWGALPGLLFLLHALALQQGAQQQLHSVLVLHWDIMCCTNKQLPIKMGIQPSPHSGKGCSGTFTFHSHLLKLRGVRWWECRIDGGDRIVGCPQGLHTGK